MQILVESRIANFLTFIKSQLKKQVQIEESTLNQSAEVCQVIWQKVQFKMNN